MSARIYIDMGKHYEKMNRDTEDADFPYKRGECVIDTHEPKKSIIDPKRAVVTIDDKDPQDAGFFLKRLDIVTGDVTYYRINKFTSPTHASSYFSRVTNPTNEKEEVLYYPLNTDPVRIKVYILSESLKPEGYEAALVYDGSASREKRIEQLTTLAMYKTFFEKDPVDDLLDELEEALKAKNAIEQQWVKRVFDRRRLIGLVHTKPTRLPNP